MKNNAFVGFTCVFLVGALLVGCTHAKRINEASKLSGTPSEASGLGNHDTQPLLNREWVLESVGQVGFEEAVGANVTITLEFDEDGCNDVPRRYALLKTGFGQLSACRF